MNRHLFLTGFMGAGKTTVGQALADNLDMLYVDLDALIVESVGKSIKSIFSEDGESAFRDVETSCLKSLSGTASAVVATGGGIVGRLENLKFMQNNGTTIYLSAEWNTLKQRLEGTTDRPLIDKDNNWVATKELFLGRCPLYEQADLVIKTDQRTVQEIVDEIRKYAQP